MVVLCEIGESLYFTFFKMLYYSRGPINRNAFFFLDKNNANSLAMFFGENRIVLVTSKEIQSY